MEEFTDKVLLFEIMSPKLYGEEYLSGFANFMLEVKEMTEEDRRILESYLMDILNGTTWHNNTDQFQI